MTIDFKVLCGWLKDLYLRDPKGFWDARAGSFDLPRVREKIPGIPVGDLILANAVVRHDIQVLEVSASIKGEIC